MNAKVPLGVRKAVVRAKVIRADGSEHDLGIVSGYRLGLRERVECWLTRWRIAKMERERGK